MSSVNTKYLIPLDEVHPLIFSEIGLATNKKIYVGNYGKDSDKIKVIESKVHFHHPNRKAFPDILYLVVIKGIEEDDRFDLRSAEYSDSVLIQ